MLLGAEVPILSAQRCNKESDHKDYDTVVEDTQICAGYLDGGVDHCYVSFNEENIIIVSVDMWETLCRATAVAHSRCWQDDVVTVSTWLVW